MSKVTKKLYYGNSVVVVNSALRENLRLEAALKALTIKTNDKDAAELTGLLSQLITKWDKLTGLLVTEKAIEYREAELEQIKLKQAAKAGRKVESSDDTDFDL